MPQLFSKDNYIEQRKTYPSGNYILKLVGTRAIDAMPATEEQEATEARLFWRFDILQKNKQGALEFTDQRFIIASGYSYGGKRQVLTTLLNGFLETDEVTEEQFEEFDPEKHIGELFDAIIAEKSMRGHPYNELVKFEKIK